jgi:hypothetical protein
MLNLVITWFLLDVVALILIIYDYRRWYGQTNHILEDATPTGIVREPDHVVAVLNCWPTRHPSPCSQQLTPNGRHPHDRDGQRA